MTGRLDPRRVQAALVCMHLDPAYAAAVRGPGQLPELAERERELLRAVDPRALAVDPYRRARAVHALLEEYPAAAALLGVPALDAFFSTPAFRTCVFEHGSMALSFGAWLGDQAGGPGRIEAAIARARRPRPDPAPGLSCNPCVAPLLLPAGSLACLERIRARLGPDPAAALASARPLRERPPRGPKQEALLIEASPAGEVSLGTASEPLVRLLLFAAGPQAHAALAAEAVRLGAEPHEADELLAGLVADGLLVAG
ncbi:hypothetical protein [Nannocystis radixulma]|uniref:DNA-binding domain-containing protein n=1 Tax=Nannocystis radixulma TaxID=2995305 RepID=A0ABT5BFM2_9BACT|nr:hypothetical protein [Nannocystis radixulma]MDC0671751.1 hypothetical protein [Nannocystis radixulma]